MYNDVARDQYYRSKGIEYSDLADTTLLLHDPDLFWKFWGDCVESYRNTDSHNGYHILNNWCAVLPKLSRPPSHLPNSTHVYTSNVDGHFRRFEKLRSGLTEIHGCAEESVCSSSIGHFITRNLITADGGDSGTQDKDVYEVSISARAGNTFAEWNGRVAEAVRLRCRQRVVTTPSSASPERVPMCLSCLAFPLRPHVVMFRDGCPNVIPAVWEAIDAYQRWESAVERDLRESRRAADPQEDDSADGGVDGVGDRGREKGKDGSASKNCKSSKGENKKLVILELGCGLRVPSVRREVEDVLVDVNRTAGPGTAVLIRINKDDADIRSDLLAPDCGEDGSLGIDCGCKEALERIDECVRAYMAGLLPPHSRLMKL